jgi:hypothetical protein
MLKLRNFIIMAAVLIAGVAKADFTLSGNEELVLDNTSSGGTHTQGTLYDVSQLSISYGGISFLNLYDTSFAEISGQGSPYQATVSQIRAYDFSTVSILGNPSRPNEVYAYNNSIVNITQTGVNSLYTHDTSTVNMSRGQVRDNLDVYGNSILNITNTASVNATINVWGTSIVNFYGATENNEYCPYVYGIDAYADSKVNIIFPTAKYGQSTRQMIYNDINAYSNSTITFIAPDFSLGSGLTLDGNRVLGTGQLSGIADDGTRWQVVIGANHPDAIINVIPEPATLSLLIFGGLALCRSRCSRYRN